MEQNSSDSRIDSSVTEASHSGQGGSGSIGKVTISNQSEEDSVYGSEDFDDQSKAETKEPYATESEVSLL